LDHTGLLELYGNRHQDFWQPGKALEYIVVRAFELEGAAVRYPLRVVMDEEEVEQIDGVVYSELVHVLLEVKDWNKSVNVEPIAKLRDQLLRRPGGVVGVVISTKGFTDAAIALTQFTSPQSILLWDGDELTWALTNQKMLDSLHQKYRYCVEQANPLYYVGEVSE
jgi:Restriction endonuclease